MKPVLLSRAFVHCPFKRAIEFLIRDPISNAFFSVTLCSEATQALLTQLNFSN